MDHSLPSQPLYAASHHTLHWHCPYLLQHLRALGVRSCPPLMLTSPSLAPLALSDAAGKHHVGDFPSTHQCPVCRHVSASTPCLCQQPSQRSLPHPPSILFIARPCDRLLLLCRPLLRCRCRDARAVLRKLQFNVSKGEEALLTYDPIHGHWLRGTHHQYQRLTHTPTPTLHPLHSLAPLHPHAALSCFPLCGPLLLCRRLPSTFPLLVPSAAAQAWKRFTRASCTGSTAC